MYVKRVAAREVDLLPSLFLVVLTLICVGLDPVYYDHKDFIRHNDDLDLFFKAVID